MCFRIASHRLSQRLLQRRRVLQRRLRIIQLQWRKLHWCGCSSEGNFSNYPRALLLSIEKKRTLCRFYFPKETVVRRNPKFISTSKTIIVNEGDTIKLPCQVSSSSVKFWVFGPCHEHQHQHHLNRIFLLDLFLVSILPQSFLSMVEPANLNNQFWLSFPCDSRRFACCVLLVLSWNNR